MECRAPFRFNSGLTSKGSRAVEHGNTNSLKLAIKSRQPVIDSAPYSSNITIETVGYHHNETVRTNENCLYFSIVFLQIYEIGLVS